MRQSGDRMARNWVLVIALALCAEIETLMEANNDRASCDLHDHFSDPYTFKEDGTIVYMMSTRLFLMLSIFVFSFSMFFLHLF